MANPSWQVSGDYFETCSCDYLCPCIFTNMTATPTQTSCTVAMVFHIDQGKYGNVALDDLNFVVAARSPGAMADGNWAVGLVLDERANAEQQQAMTAIASGQAGGPMAGLSALIGQFLGAQAKPIKYLKNGKQRSVHIPGALEQAVAGVSSPAFPDDTIYLDKTLHPANPRLALAKATQSELSVFGLNWTDNSGKNNGHFAPFSWQG
jgi:hypothetical protein